MTVMMGTGGREGGEGGREGGREGRERGREGRERGREGGGWVDVEGGSCRVEVSSVYFASRSIMNIFFLRNKHFSIFRYLSFIRDVHESHSVVLYLQPPQLNVNSLQLICIL